MYRKRPRQTHTKTVKVAILVGSGTIEDLNFLL